MASNCGQTGSVWFLWQSWPCWLCTTATASCDQAVYVLSTWPAVVARLLIVYRADPPPTPAPHQPPSPTLLNHEQLHPPQMLSWPDSLELGRSHRRRHRLGRRRWVEGCEGRMRVGWGGGGGMRGERGGREGAAVRGTGGWKMRNSWTSGFCGKHQL